MRLAWIGLPALLQLLGGCKDSAPVVNVNTVPPGQGVAFTSAYDIDEGSALDLVVDTGTAGATVTTSTLPKNATLANGIFSFTPDYSQAGLYSITFTVTAGTSVTTQTVGIRVQNVIHIATPPLTKATEGSPAPDLMFASDNPPGTVVNYTADVSAAPGAVFDPVAGKLSFVPGWSWLDSSPASLAIDVTAQGQEIDTGEQRTSTARVLYEITEATSFSQELQPLFLMPLGATGTQGAPNSSPPPEYTSKDGHNCLFCHDGKANAPAGMDFTPDSIYSQLYKHPVADISATSAACYGQAALGVQRVVPGDLTKSLWFMKISGTDGNGGTTIPCGAQMPENLAWYYWTVGDNQDKWNECPEVSGEDTCREALDCVATDITCKLNSRYVRKAALWIQAGAPQN